MLNGESASREAANRATTQAALAGGVPARAPHAHRCLACAATYDCPDAEEIGYCTPVCQPCYWMELGSQLRIYEEMVAELRRKRAEIEHRIGKAVCRTAAARRHNIKTDANLLVAFGSVFGTQFTNILPGLRTEAHEGGSHE